MDNEPIVRLTAFVGVFSALAVWEALTPRRPLSLDRRARWPGNLGVLVVGSVLLRAFFPAAAVGAALWAAERGYGLLHLAAPPAFASMALTVLVLDLAIYLQHRLFHAVGPLWRLHRMHHADLDFDVTTGLRFHPLEILLSMLIKIAVIVPLGAHPTGVLVFEVLLNATSMFNHANVRIPGRFEGVLRSLVVTPEMHRVHHSIRCEETDSNFGFNLPWWDRLFGTYRARPADGHIGMTIGIPAFREVRELRLDRLLLQPLRQEALRTGNET